MVKLDKDEKEILDSFERGEWKPVKGAKKKIKSLSHYARNTFQKNRRVNIRISTKDLEGVQKKALEHGIPYQTLISSLIHKYVAGYYPF